MAQKIDILGLNHTSFTVGNVDEIVKFFVEGLGFTFLDKSPRDGDAIRKVTGVPGAEMVVAFVQGSGHRFEFIEYPSPADKGQSVLRPCDNGFAHTAIDVVDIDQALDAAAGYSFTPVNAPVRIDSGPNNGRIVAYLRNPEGFTIEFIQQISKVDG